MKRRIFISLLFSSVLGVLLSMILLTVVSYREQLSQMKQQTKEYAEYLYKYQDDEIGTERQYLSGWDFRITIIDNTGVVEYDSHSDISQMDNHRQRKEVSDSLELGVGEALRYSTTKGTDTYYYALKLSNGDVLRVSGETRNVWHIMGKMAPWALLTIITTILILALFSSFQSKRLLQPVNRIDLKNPLENDTYEEISPLLRRIHKQNSDIQKRIDIIERQRQELLVIMQQMQEGLIVLDNQGCTLSINQSAADVFMMSSEECIGKNYLDYLRKPEVSEAISKSFQGMASNARLEKHGRHFHVYTNPVVQNSNTDGVLVLIWDATDQYQNEQMRREFTANVSHELKTPLTSISGYAELLSSGIVKDKDVEMFSQRIYSETKRLIQLVEDIIRLSQLDEENLIFERQEVNIYSLVLLVYKQLSDFADERGVSFEVNGDNTLTILAIPTILEEMIRNLCDNAIKYNRECGNVVVNISQNDNYAVVSVSDTGIGVAPEYHRRIFERFFRVDKSHSRKSGGTGLGLSIVKHGVQYHKGKYSLKSELDKGTKITLELPLK